MSDLMVIMSGNFILTVCTACVQNGNSSSLFFSLPLYCNPVPCAHFAINIHKCQNVNVSKKVFIRVASLVVVTCLLLMSLKVPHRPHVRRCNENISSGLTRFLRRFHVTRTEASEPMPRPRAAPGQHDARMTRITVEKGTAGALSTLMQCVAVETPSAT